MKKRFIHFLYLTNFITGAVVMIVELLGTRFMAPFFGASLYVWTSLITVTLVGLALGYRAGGYMADKKPRASFLFGLIFTSGLLLVAVLVFRKPILTASANLDLKFGALIAASILFGPSLFLLGSVAPFSVKLCTKELKELGNVVGRLYSISTIGSFVGTLAAGFLLLPNLTNTATLVFCASALLILSGAYFLAFRRDFLPATASIAMLGLSALIAIRSTTLPEGEMYEGRVKWRVIEQRNSFYGRLRVVDQIFPRNPSRNRRVLLNDGLNQGSYNLETKDPASTFPYALCDLVLHHEGDLKRALVLGLGAGLVPRVLSEYAGTGTNSPSTGEEPGGNRFDSVVVEINPEMLKIAREYFDFPAEDLDIYIADARTWVSDYEITPETPPFDAVVFDTFLGDNVPTHLLTREMFTEVRRILAPDGAVALNVFGSIRGDKSRLIASLVRTLSGAPEKEAPFEHVQVFSKEATSIAHNVFILAYSGPFKKHPGELTSVFPAPDVRNDVENALKDQTKKLEGISKAHLLTDNYNVAQYLDLEVKEDIRENIFSTWEGALAE